MVISYFPHLFCHLSLVLTKNLGPQDKLEFLDFPPITEIDGANFGSHKSSKSMCNKLSFSLKLKSLLIYFLLIHIY